MLQCVVSAPLAAPELQLDGLSTGTDAVCQGSLPRSSYTTTEEYEMCDCCKPCTPDGRFTVQVETGVPDKAYTIGLTEYGLPELVITGLHSDLPPSSSTAGASTCWTRIRCCRVSSSTGDRS